MTTHASFQSALDLLWARLPHSAKLLIVGVLAVVPIAGSAGEPISFTTGPTVANIEQFGALADLNSDGMLDVVTTEGATAQGGPTVRLRLGDGNGGFGGAVAYTLPDHANSLAVGDLNGDGIPDIAVAIGYQASIGSPGRIALYFGDGGSGFVTGPVLPVFDYPDGVAIADLNGDGDADLLIGSATQRGLIVILGTGGGAFAPGVGYWLGTPPTYDRFEVADFNLDGKLDIVALQYNASTPDSPALILFGNGDGTFGAPVALNAGLYTIGVSAADFDGDGKLDLVVNGFDVNLCSDTVNVLYGDGAGGFAAPVAVATGSCAYGVTARDVNGDGRPDLIVTTVAQTTTGPGTYAAYAVRNLGNRAFDTPVPFFGPAGIGSYPLAIGDLNRDGRPDILVTDAGYSSATEFFNATRFPARRHDLDGDLHSDIMWRNASSGEDFIFFMNGAAVGAGSNYTNAVPDQTWQIVGSGDFDGDGKADLLWRNGSTGDDYIFLMDGTTVKAGSGYTNTVGAPWSVAGVGDFDGDGKADILWRNSSTGDDYLFFMDGVTVKAGSGYTNAVPDQSWQVAGVGDFDGDGKADVVWRNSSTGDDYLFFMDGLAVKAGSGYTNPVPDVNWQVAGVGDHDGDGKADILWRNGATGEDFIFVMNGTAVLGTSGYTNSVPDVNWQIVGTGDYDGDGRADILWRNASTGDNYVFLMNGTTVQPGSGYTNSVPDLNWHVQNL